MPNRDPDGNLQNKLPLGPKKLVYRSNCGVYGPEPFSLCVQLED